MPAAVSSRNTPTIQWRARNRDRKNWLTLDEAGTFMDEGALFRPGGHPRWGMIAYRLLAEIVCDEFRGHYFVVPPAKSVVFAGYAGVYNRLRRFPRTLLRWPPAKSVVFAGCAGARQVVRPWR